MSDPGSRGSWPARADSVPAARRMVRDHLRLDGLLTLVEDAELLVSELVSNVVLHVGGTVAVTVTSAAAEVVLAVDDDSPVPPQLRLLSSTASTGRGMRLVHSLSAAHGVRTRPDGKTVWVRLTPAAAGRGDDALAQEFAEIDWLAELESDVEDGVATAVSDPVPAATTDPGGPVETSGVTAAGRPSTRPAA